MQVVVNGLLVKTVTTSSCLHYCVENNYKRRKHQEKPNKPMYSSSTDETVLVSVCLRYSVGQLLLLRAGRCRVGVASAELVRFR